MQHISRRRLLRLSGVGGLTAASGGLAGILVSGRAPAYAQGTTLHWLKFVDFVPVSDQLLRGKITEECQKALGIKLQVETINGDGVQARITSAIQSKTGPDILMAVNNWSQLYAESVVDVSDVAEEIGKAQGGYYETAKAIAYDGTKWLAVPNTIVGLQIANRIAWWNDIGYGPEKYPATWEEWREAGKKLKAKGHPQGQTLASVSRIFRRPGTNIEPSAKRSRPSSALTARPWPTRSVTVLRSGTPICGRGAARKSRPTARQSC